jgi:two-component system, NarL family, nitrate/nitrite response regulator NarL
VSAPGERRAQAAGRRRIRLVLVDDQALIRAGVRRVLDADPEFEVVAEAGDADEALARAGEACDCVVLDLNMPGRDGFDILRAIRLGGPTPRVLVLSLHSEPAYVARAVRDGADGYLLKETAVLELPRAIRAVMRGEGFYSPGARVALTEAMRPPEPSALDRLTPREVEVLRRVARGEPSKAIAGALGIGVRTVETHRANLMRKLELWSVAELTRFAIEQGLLKPT